MENQVHPSKGFDDNNRNRSFHSCFAIFLTQNMKNRWRASGDLCKIMHAMATDACERETLVHIRIPSHSWDRDVMKSLGSFQKLNKRASDGTNRPSSV